MYMLLCRQQMCSFRGHVYHHVASAHHFRRVRVHVNSL
jgi:hypothetical protein